MCGVFAWVSKDKKPVDIARLKAIATETMQRGPHAFGFAWIDSLGRLKCYKQTGRITDHLGLLNLAHDAQFLIGHCRFATHGDPGDRINNHPHPCDGGWLVHNGVIHNYQNLVWHHDLSPVSECDSEVLGLLTEKAKGNLIDRCVYAVGQTSPGPLVMLGLWSRPGRLVAIRRGNPLHIGFVSDGAYLASLSEELPGRVQQVKDNKALEFGDAKEVAYAF